MPRHVKETNQLLSRLASQGWSVERASKHWKLRSPAGRVVFCPLTPSDWRAIRNVRAKVRREGADL